MLLMYNIFIWKKINKLQHISYFPSMFRISSDPSCCRMNTCINGVIKLTELKNTFIQFSLLQIGD